MPRYPRIYSESPVPSGTSTSMVPLATPGEGALVAAGQDLSQAGNVFAKQGATIDAQLRKADAGLELDQAMSQLKVQFAEREAALKDQGVHPDAYAPALTQELTTLGKSLLGTMRYPEAQAEFQRKLVQFQGEQGVKAINEGWKLKHAMIELGWSVQQREDATTAVFSSSATERQDAFARGLARPDEGLRRGFYSAEQAAGKLTQFLAEVEKAGATRDFAKPELQLRVVEGLLTGQYKHLSPTEQQALAKTLTDQRDATMRTADAKAEKDAKLVREETETALLIRAQQKDITATEIYATATRVGLNREAVAAITHELAKPTIEAPSDPGTRDRVSADVLSYSPRIAEAEIKRLHRDGILNTTDRNDFLAKRTSRMTHLIERGDSLSVQQQGMAERWARAELGIPDFMPPGVDPKREQAWAGVMREFSKRSNAFRDGGEETPMAVARDIIPVYKKLLDGNDRLDFTKTDSVARFKTMGDLQAAKPAMSKAQYEAERERTQALLDLIKQNLQRSIEQGLAAGSGGPTTPKKSKKSTDLPAVK